MIDKANTSRVETEVKFIIPNKATFAALKNATRLGNFQLTPVGTKITTDRYLDTPHKHIMRTGYACRIRSIKQQQQILTLKSLTPPSGGVHRRQEFEMEVDTDQPGDWPPSEAKELVLSIAEQEPLKVLFIIHQIRHVYYALSDNKPIIELSLDEVSLEDVSKVDFFELEAELIQAGNETDLARFGNALQANWSLQPETRSKFERALARINS